MKNRFLQPALPFLVLPLLTASALAQMTGVSHPDDAGQAVAPAAQSDHYVMPSHQAAQTAVQPAPATPIAQQAYPATGPAPAVSYPATGPAPATASELTPAPALIPRQPLPATATTDGRTSPDYGTVQTAAYTPEPAALPGADDGVVEVRLIPHQLNEGVVLKTRLDQVLSTETTLKGSAFTAQLLGDAGHSGEILIPAGSIIHGTVTDIHGGKRITGMASIRLQAQSVTLPDGLTYPLHATVSGIRSEEDQHVNSEGAIQPTTHPKETAIALGSVTGAATIMGAAIGGGVGAVVGAGVGVGAGAIWWLKRDHQETLPSGTTILFSLDEPFQATAR